MNIDINESRIILMAFLTVVSEYSLKDSAINICTRIFNTYPELIKEYDFLAGYCGIHK